MAQLWQKELDFFIAKLAQLRAKDICDSYMIGISAMFNQLIVINLGVGEAHERYATERKGF